jgi:hypothetical protein
MRGNLETGVQREMNRRQENHKKNKKPGPRRRSKRRPNPVKLPFIPPFAPTTTSGNLFEDALFLHHLGSAIFRALEVTGKYSFPAASAPTTADTTDEVDAEFIEPEDTVQ